MAVKAKRLKGSVIFPSRKTNRQAKEYQYSLMKAVLQRGASKQSGFTMLPKHLDVPMFKRNFKMSIKLLYLQHQSFKHARQQKLYYLFRYLQTTDSFIPAGLKPHLLFKIVIYTVLRLSDYLKSNKQLIRLIVKL